MTIKDYIKEKFSSFGVLLNEADLLEILLSTKVDGEGELSQDVFDKISISIIQFIPSLLARPISYSVGENGFNKSKSWDINGIKTYYSMLCKQYALKDELNNKPQIIFL